MSSTVDSTELYLSMKQFINDIILSYDKRSFTSSYLERKQMGLPIVPHFSSIGKLTTRSPFRSR